MMLKQTRRRFLTTLSMAGAAGLLGPPPALAAEGPLETTSVRFMKTPSLCHAPQFVAEELLRAEGFTEIRYIEGASSVEINEAVTSGKVDFNMHFAPSGYRSSTRAARSQCCRGCMSAALSWSGKKVSTALPI